MPYVLARQDQNRSIQPPELELSLQEMQEEQEKFPAAIRYKAFGANLKW